MGRCGGVAILLESVANATPPTLPPLLTLLADWLRAPSLRADFRKWVAPPGMLAASAEEEAAADALRAAGERGAHADADGADALRLVLRSWQVTPTPTLTPTPDPHPNP